MRDGVVRYLAASLSIPTILSLDLIHRDARPGGARPAKP